MHLLGHIERIRAHACRWAGLDEVTVPTAAVTDDDTEAWSDLAYLRGLLDEILALASVTPGAAQLIEKQLARFPERNAL